MQARDDPRSHLMWAYVSIVDAQRIRVRDRGGEIGPRQHLLGTLRGRQFPVFLSFWGYDTPLKL
ncbi:MAG: hypothetical protein ACETWR_21030 [Anaerolineae bacterium]